MDLAPAAHLCNFDSLWWCSCRVVCWVVLVVFVRVTCFSSYTGCAQCQSTTGCDVWVYSTLFYTD